MILRVASNLPPFDCGFDNFFFHFIFKLPDLLLIFMGTI